MKVIKQMIVMLGIFILMVLEALAMISVTTMRYHNELYYNTAVFLIQENTVDKVVIYDSYADIYFLESSHIVELPDRSTFVEFLQEEIEKGNGVRVKKAEISLETLAILLFICFILTCILAHMYMKEHDDFIKLFSISDIDDDDEMSEEERKIKAYHEAGHAVVANNLHQTECIEKISITPEENRGGSTVFNMRLCTKTDFEELLVITLAGRAAERVALNDIYVTSIYDLKEATKTAREMITIYGMDEEIGPISIYDEDSEEADLFGADLSNKIDIRTQEILKESEKKAIQILTVNKKMLDKIAEKLIEEKTLSGDELKIIMKAHM